ncbi:EamA family transporter [Microbulbifer sp. A4B17]|uniref:EamA family transporter n=1 Tax=Microbulbifer sp. A4B17 TaxID=359370 RepID=UPI001300956A|nr:EamA family transporter [Microbulbifer sp. A4B17]
MSFKSILLALLAVCIIGLNYPVIKVALVDLPPLLLAAIRFTLISVPLVFFCPFPKTSIANVVAIGFFLEFLSLGLMYYALKSDVQAGVASLLMQSQVLFTLLLCALLFEDRINRRQCFGLLIAVIGFSIFFYSADKGGSTTAKGFFLMMGAGLSWAIANLVFRRMSGVNLLHLMVWASLVPPIPLLVMSLAFESHTPWVLISHTNIETWLSIIYQAFIVTLLGYILWGDLMRRYSSVRIAPFGLLVPIIGIIGSSIILSESLSGVEWWASFLVLSGITLCVIKFRDRNPREKCSGMVGS